MSYLLGRLVEYRAINEEGNEERRTGHVVHAGNEFLLVESGLGELELVDPAFAQICTVYPGHPAGLRPVTYRWPEKTSEFYQGWLISLTATDDQTIALVETVEGDVLVTDFYNIRFMDRGLAPPSADSIHPAWLI